MFTHITSTETQAFIYNFTYMLAFIVSGGILLLTGIKKKYPVASWLLIIAVLVFFVILGNKMLTATPYEWGEFFRSSELPQSGRKSVLGGIVGLLAGLLIIKFVLKIKIPIADHFAYLVPVTIGIARIGCLLNGCCHGLPTNLPWGIEYGMGTHAFNLHQSVGLIPSDASISLPVHPTQIYDILICIITIFLIRKFRNYWNVKGNRLVFAVLCYTALRFFEEFFRDSSALPFIAESYFGFKVVQWIILMGMTLIFIYLIISEHFVRTIKRSVTSFHVFHVRESIILSIIIFVIILNYNWFSHFELFTLSLFLLPAIVSYSIRTYKQCTTRQLRWVIPLIFLSGFIVMGQTYIPKTGEKKITYLEIAVDGLISHYSQEVSQFTHTGTDCDGNSYPVMGNDQMRSYDTYMGSVDISKTIIQSKYTRKKFGGGIFYGRDLVQCDLNGLREVDNSFGVHFRGQFDWKYFGFGIGAHLGQHRIAIANKDRHNLSQGDFENEMGEYFFLPVQFIRVGVLDKLYLDLDMSYDLPAGKPMPFVSGGLGSGLGRIDGTFIAAGYSDAGYYLKGACVINKLHVINAYFADNFMCGYDNRWMVTLGYRYRFNFNPNR